MESREFQHIVQQVTAINQRYDAALSAIIAYVAAIPGAENVDYNRITKDMAKSAPMPGNTFNPPSPGQVANAVVSQIHRLATERSHTEKERQALRQATMNSSVKEDGQGRNTD